MAVDCLTPYCFRLCLISEITIFPNGSQISLIDVIRYAHTRMASIGIKTKSRNVYVYFCMNKLHNQGLIFTNSGHAIKPNEKSHILKCINDQWNYNGVRWTLKLLETNLIFPQNVTPVAIGGRKLTKKIVKYGWVIWLSPIFILWHLGCIRADWSTPCQVSKHGKVIATECFAQEWNPMQQASRRINPINTPLAPLKVTVCLQLWWNRHVKVG